MSSEATPRHGSLMDLTRSRTASRSRSSEPPKRPKTSLPSMELRLLKKIQATMTTVWTASPETWASILKPWPVSLP